MSFLVLFEEEAANPGIIGQALLLSGTIFHDTRNDAYIDIISSAARSLLDRTANNNDSDQQSDASKRPAILDVNGVQMVDFDGTNDELQLNSAVHDVANGDHTWVFVSKRDTESGAVKNLFGGSNGSDNYWKLEYGNTAGEIKFNCGSGSDLVITGIDNTKTNVIIAKLSGTTLSLSVNGGTAATNTDGEYLNDISEAYLGRRGSTSNLHHDGQIGVSSLLPKATSSDEDNNIGIFCADAFGVYHPNATWITSATNAYTALEQFLIHQYNFNKEDAFKDTTRNVFQAILQPAESTRREFDGTTSNVKTLKDSRDGVDYDFTQSDGGKMPAVGEETANGVDLMTANGTSHILNGKAALGAFGAGDWTYIGVARNDSTSGYTNLFSIGANESGGSYLKVGYHPNGNIQARCMGYLNDDSGGDTSQLHVVTVRRSGDDGYVRYNKLTAKTNSGGFTDPTKTEVCNFLASPRYGGWHKGAAGDQMFANYAMTVSEEEAKIDELMTKYGIV